MDRSSRSELVKTVEAQNEKIAKYERKLRGQLNHEDSSLFHVFFPITSVFVILFGHT